MYSNAEEWLTISNVFLFLSLLPAERVPCIFPAAVLQGDLRCHM